MTELALTVAPPLKLINDLAEQFDHACDVLDADVSVFQ